MKAKQNVTSIDVIAFRGPIFELLVEIVVFLVTSLTTLALKFKISKEF